MRILGSDCRVNFELQVIPGNREFLDFFVQGTALLISFVEVDQVQSAVPWFIRPLSEKAGN